MPEVERQKMKVDIACVGFGPAMAGFLTTLTRQMTDKNANILSSPSQPGTPLQVLCYERADDISAGVSGVVTKAKYIRQSFPDLKPADIPLAAPVTEERILYLLDPIGASNRSWIIRTKEWFIKAFGWANPFYKNYAVKLPFIPPFLAKHGGMVLSMGQFNQWVGSQLMGTGLVQIWPAMPVDSAIIEGSAVKGIRLMDQGTDKKGNPEANYMPGMDIEADLTVIGDGPSGPVSHQLEEVFGMPDNRHKHEWAVGMKVVVDLPEGHGLKPGTVLHTFGYPEPEIFGFMYVYPNNIASLGIFVPSTLANPARTSYRTLQHWMMHPYLWQYLKGATLRSWAAKSLMESGLRGEPQLAGDGFAVIGETSGSTNILTGSGVDEAWQTGVMLAEGVLKLLRQKKPFTKANLDEVYVQVRRRSAIHKEGKIAAKSRNGFQYGFIAGILGMGLTGMTAGLLNIPAKSKPAHQSFKSLEEYYKGRLTPEELRRIKVQCRQKGTTLHDAIMDKLGWPPIPFDGKLLVTQQDVLLMGGKVQAPASGVRDHVLFLRPELCRQCEKRVCMEMCSAQAIAPGPEGTPVFDREKCIHCGGCIWNCSVALPEDPEKNNIRFIAGSGGLHSAEN